MNDYEKIKIIRGYKGDCKKVNEKHFPCSECPIQPTCFNLFLTDNGDRNYIAKAWWDGHNAGRQAEPIEPHAYVEAIKNIQYDSHAEGCGLEDNRITDRYDAMSYGYHRAIQAAIEAVENVGD